MAISTDIAQVGGSETFIPEQNLTLAGSTWTKSSKGYKRTFDIYIAYAFEPMYSNTQSKITIKDAYIRKLSGGETKIWHHSVTVTCGSDFSNTYSYTGSSLKTMASTCPTLRRVGGGDSFTINRNATQDIVVTLSISGGITDGTWSGSSTGSTNLIIPAQNNTGEIVIPDQGEEQIRPSHISVKKILVELLKSSRDCQSHKLLWENPNGETTSFGQQTIQASAMIDNINNYDYLKIFCSSSHHGTLKELCMTPSLAGGNSVSIKGTTFISYLDSSSGTPTIYRRDLTLNTDGSIAFQPCHTKAAFNSTSYKTNNNYIIPYRIYGIKGGIE